MADVFISYHRSEGTSALVRRIARELESMNISCWYDTKDPDPGYFTQTIEREILRCKVFLLIWDEGANNSEWCLTETYTAFEGENHAVRIPFQIGQCKKHPEMSFYMRRCQIFSHESPENADIQKLIMKIAALFGKNPAKIIKRGSCGLDGDNVTYTLDENGVLTISGNGDMYNYYFSDDIPWLDKCALISVVRIQKGVTSIGYSAFSYCDNLKSVIIPDSVTLIGNFAFKDCLNLTRVSVPVNAEIQSSAFSDTTRVISRY